MPDPSENDDDKATGAFVKQFAMIVECNCQIEALKISLGAEQTRTRRLMRSIKATRDSLWAAITVALVFALLTVFLSALSVRNATNIRQLDRDMDKMDMTVPQVVP
jgi:hypothetical protein